MDRLIPINITKGRISYVRLDFKDDEKVLDMSASIALISEQGETITEISLDTAHWQKNKTIELPIEVIPLAGRIRQLAEEQCIAKINGRHVALPAPKVEDLFEEE